MADTDSRAGTRYSSPAILEWTAKVHAAHDEALAQAFEAPAHHGLPAIQLGPSESRLITLMLRMVNAVKVVEVGTLAGYSALRLAEGLPPEGHVWTIEVDPRHAEVARRNIAAARQSHRIDVLVGDARSVLASLEGMSPFCAVFLDADKESYEAYGQWAAANVRRGGLLVADNTFLFGQLLDDTPRAASMRRFHEQARSAFETTCVPTPDGLLVGLRR